MSALLHGVIDFSGAGDNTVIAADADNYIEVIAMEFVIASQQALTIKAGSRSLTGAQTLAAKVLGIQMYGQDAEPWYTCNPGEAFIMNLGSGAQTSGSLKYRLRPAEEN
jgi:hypothetical protein